MNEQTNERTDGQMDRLTDCWMNDKYDTDIKSVFFRQFYNNLPKINISTDHADTTVPTKNSHGKIKRCDDAYQTNWIPLLKESVTWTWCETNVIE